MEKYSPVISVKKAGTTGAIGTIAVTVSTKLTAILWPKIETVVGYVNSFDIPQLFGMNFDITAAWLQVTLSTVIIATMAAAQNYAKYYMKRNNVILKIKDALKKSSER
jgi:NADH:ubiquinone oxidoreductase subunit 5 (subunit L)/multisubunit Na+/H+ antiporter MnhA subunit